MKRRKFLLGVGSATAAGSALIGSGAFSRVESHRDVSIAVAEDPDAYLGLDACNTVHGDNWVSIDEYGHLAIDISDHDDFSSSGPAAPGEGVNSDSTTWFDRVFRICNQGKKDACVWIPDGTIPEVPGSVDGEKIPQSAQGEPRVDFYLEDNRGQSIVGEENAIGIPLGECRCIGITTRTHGDVAAPTTLFDDEIQINADINANCTTEPSEDITEEGRLSLAYEDLPKDGSDWDYNDWIVDIFGTYTKCGEGGSGGVKEFQWDIVPQARGAGDTHRFEFDFDCPGEYDVTYYDQDGNDLGSPPGASGSFSGNSGMVDITVWEDTSDVFSTTSNDDGSCEKPSQWAELTVTFDECCDIGTFDGSFGDHGSGLPFNPILENNDKAVKVEKGDIRLLVVPEQWEWPTGGEHIADAYDDVDRDSDDKPIFNSGWRNGGVDANRVTSCNFEVDETDNSIESP